MKSFSIADVPAESITAANPPSVIDALSRDAKREANLLAKLSHELRTPLNGIMGSIELLELTGLSIEQLDLVAALKTSAEALAKNICAIGETSLGLGNQAQTPQVGPSTYGTSEAPKSDCNGQAFQTNSVPTAPEGTIQQRPTRLLLVDDNQINLVVIGAMLMKSGHNVVKAHNGMEAVNASVAEKFDAILTDIDMPILDGVSAARRIRDSSGPNRDTPIIALTASTQSKGQGEFRDAGINSVLFKPLVKATLDRALLEVGVGEMSKHR